MHDRTQCLLRSRFARVNAAGLLLTLLAGCAGDGPTPPRLETDAPWLERKGPPVDGAFRFTTVEVPGALSTIAWGINSRGDIVGTYRDATGFHGYVLRDGEFVTIDYPGAAITEARGIGPSGDIVGSYRRPGEPAVNVHGFVLTRHGEFVAVDYPGHTNTIPQRILPDGTILGCRHDNDMMASMRGIVMDRTGDREIDAFASMNNGATPSQQRVVGLHTDMMSGRTEGYVIDDGVFTPFVVPGSTVTMTAAWDVSPAGDIVGVYRDAAGFHGFLRRGVDHYAPIDVPGATATRAFGINSRGDVVGSYVSNGKTYAFLAEQQR